MENAGIVCLPTLVASDAIRDGHLQVVLSDHLLSAFWLSAVYAGTSRNAFKLRLFIDHIATQFKQLPPWDAELIDKGFISNSIVTA
jgi:DNA-binding transcriptional LysR family regulator